MSKTHGGTAGGTARSDARVLFGVTGGLARTMIVLVPCATAKTGRAQA